MKKKTLTALFTATAMAFALSACGQEAAVDTSTASAGTETVAEVSGEFAETPETEEVVEITYTEEEKAAIKGALKYIAFLEGEHNALGGITVTRTNYVYRVSDYDEDVFGYKMLGGYPGNLIKYKNSGFSSSQKFDYFGVTNTNTIRELFDKFVETIGEPTLKSEFQEDGSVFGYWVIDNGVTICLEGSMYDYYCLANSEELYEVYTADIADYEGDFIIGKKPSGDNTGSSSSGDNISEAEVITPEPEILGPTGFINISEIIPSNIYYSKSDYNLADFTFTYSDEPNYNNVTISLFDIPEDVTLGVSETYEGSREFDFHGITGGSPQSCLAEFYNELLAMIGEPSLTGIDEEKNIQYVGWAFDDDSFIVLVENLDGVYFKVRN